MRLSVVLPARNAGTFLSRSLPALAASTLPRTHWELIVVDDASTDDTCDVAGKYADRLLRPTRKAKGPAFCRNRGAEIAQADVVLFLDADCVAPDHLLARFLSAFEEYPEAAAIFGAYDDQPADPHFVSQYRNLLHHYVHVSTRGPSRSFWAGCGAVRAGAFREAGMFDERFASAQIEDIELGYRISDTGRPILLEPALQVTHLKRWTLQAITIGDLRNRAIPWLHLLIDRNELRGAQGVSLAAREKASTALTALSFAALVPGSVTRSGSLLGLAFVCVAGVILLNLKLYAWFARKRGFWFAVRAVPLHVLYYGVAAVALPIVLAQRLIRRARPDPAPIDRNGAASVRP